jgi:DNA uptake protein ComE-like DNA-binding protein
MYLNTRPIKNWFGFSRRERRATFILLIIIVMIIGVRYLFPDSMIAIEDFSGTIPRDEKSVVYLRKDNLYKAKAFSSDSFTQTKFKKTSYPGKSIPQKIVSIDINHCDSATLVRLPGIGPVLSVRIVKYRRLLGGFASIEQLREVYGLKPETFEMIKGRIFADSTQVREININSATFKEMIRFPYFEKYEVTAILKFRELKGKITGINDLTSNRLITAEKARKVRPYLKYDE